MSDIHKLRLQAAALKLTAVLGEASIQAASVNKPRLANTARLYRDVLQVLAPLIGQWATQNRETSPLAERVAATMETADDLLRTANLRGVLHQTHAALSALPGLPDFPPVEVPPAPGDDDDDDDEQRAR